MFFPCFRSTCEVSTSDQLARSLLAGWIGMQTAVMCNVRSHTVDYTARFVVLAKIAATSFVVLYTTENEPPEVFSNVKDLGGS